MFNFIFEGKIGEMLAPVVPSNKLFLAVQHHKNADVQRILHEFNFDYRKYVDGGNTAVHIACRYNNRIALELMMSKSEDILRLVDGNGNTCLHMAAKYGHLELCKMLVEKGCSVVDVNNQRQTPYDVAENHMIRQYLMPLQLKAQHNPNDPSNMFLGGGSYGYQQQQPEQMYAAPAPAGYGPPPPSGGGVSYSAPPPAAAQQPPSYGPPTTVTPKSGDDTPFMPAQPQTRQPYQEQQQRVSPPAGGGGEGGGGGPALPQTSTGLGAATVAPPPPAGAPSSGHSSNVGVVPSYTYNKSTPTRLIQPDGFHSSASDPNLQVKYGHVKQIKNVAPPPMAGQAYVPQAQFGVQNNNMYSSSSGGGSSGSGGPPQQQYAPPAYVNNTGAGVFNRYVQYDPHTNAPMPPPPVAVAPTAQQQSAISSTAPPPNLWGPPGAAPSSSSPPGPGTLTTASPPCASPSGGSGGSSLPNSGSGSRLSNSAPPIIFNPATDVGDEVIAIDAKSRGVL